MIPIKNAREIEKMRQACRTASDILHRVSDFIRPGITTKDVDEAAADFMSESRVKSAFLGYRLGHRVFPGNICISLNDEVVHGIGGQRRIQYGDIVKLDIGIIQDGWVGDNATTVPVGIVDERTDQLLRVTENALARAIRMLRSEDSRQRENGANDLKFRVLVNLLSPKQTDAVVIEPGKTMTSDHNLGRVVIDRHAVDPGYAAAKLRHHFLRGTGRLNCKELVLRGNQHRSGAPSVGFQCSQNVITGIYGAGPERSSPQPDGNE